MWCLSFLFRFYCPSKSSVSKTFFPVVLQLGATPLHRAAGAGQLTATEVLLTEGKPKFNVKDKHGETPLFLAAASGHEEVGVLNF